MNDYERVSIELGEAKRELTKNHGEIVYLLELLRRCRDALVAEEDYHSGLLEHGYDILEDVKKELSLWKTERRCDVV